MGSSYKKHKDNNRCSTGCGNPTRPGKTCCQTCADTKAANTVHHKAEGLCIKGCGNPARPSKTECEACATKGTNRKTKLKTDGLCIRGCGARARLDKVECDECAVKTAAYNNRPEIRELQHWKKISRGFTV
jgi:hypothetical protein